MLSKQIYQRTNYWETDWKFGVGFVFAFLPQSISTYVRLLNESNLTVGFVNVNVNGLWWTGDLFRVWPHLLPNDCTYTKLNEPFQDTSTLLKHIGVNREWPDFFELIERLCAIVESREALIMLKISKHEVDGLQQQKSTQGSTPVIQKQQTEAALWTDSPKRNSY